MLITEAKENIKKLIYDSKTEKIQLDHKTNEALYVALIALEKYEKIRSVMIRQEFQIQQGFERGKTSAYMKIKAIIFGEGRDE